MSKEVFSIFLRNKSEENKNVKVLITIIFISIILALFLTVYLINWIKVNSSQEILKQSGLSLDIKQPMIFRGFV